MAESKKAPTIEQRLVRIEKTLASLISWTAQSANSPINRIEAKELLERLDGDAD